jgi:glycosyltransferase involved in cell wall biosynthesis
VLTAYTPDLPPAPAVSVIIPAHQCDDVIEDALRSALAQTWSDHEVIVVNDGCPRTNELERVLTRYRSAIRYMRRPHGGPGAARNTALQFARGRYLAFLDADDVWHPHFLERLVPHLEEDRTLDVAYCDAIFEGGEFGGRRFMDVFPSGDECDVTSMLAGECTILSSGALARAARVREVAPFDESLELAEDYDLWLRMMLDGARFVPVREVLLRARMLPTRLCAEAENAERAVLKVLAKLEQRHDLSVAHREAFQSARKRIGNALDRRGQGRHPLRRWMRNR